MPSLKRWRSSLQTPNSISIASKVLTISSIRSSTSFAIGFLITIMPNGILLVCDATQISVNVRELIMNCFGSSDFSLYLCSAVWWKPQQDNIGNEALCFGLVLWNLGNFNGKARLEMTMVHAFGVGWLCLDLFYQGYPRTSKQRCGAFQFHASCTYI